MTLDWRGESKETSPIGEGPFRMSSLSTTGSSKVATMNSSSQPWNTLTSLSHLVARIQWPSISSWLTWSRKCPWKRSSTKRSKTWIHLICHQVNSWRCRRSNRQWMPLLKTTWSLKHAPRPTSTYFSERSWWPIRTLRAKKQLSRTFMLSTSCRRWPIWVRNVYLERTSIRRLKSSSLR